MHPGLEQQNLIISYLSDQNFDSAHTVYGHVQEIIPNDIPDPWVKL